MHSPNLAQLSSRTITRRFTTQKTAADNIPIAMLSVQHYIRGRSDLNIIDSAQPRHEPALSMFVRSVTVRLTDLNYTMLLLNVKMGAYALHSRMTATDVRLVKIQPMIHICIAVIQPSYRMHHATQARAPRGENEGGGGGVILSSLFPNLMAYLISHHKTVRRG